MTGHPNPRPGHVLFPVADLVPYDDLSAFGDDGWDLDRLLADVRVHGIRTPLEIARSAAQLATGDESVYVFNGIHRLTVARMLDLRLVPVAPFTRNEDAVHAEDIFPG